MDNTRDYARVSHGRQWSDYNETYEPLSSLSPAAEADAMVVPVQVFQCLLIDGENSGEEALRNAELFVISDEQFQTFVDRHRSVGCLVPESNSAMRYSYIILDEYVS